MKRSVPILTIALLILFVGSATAQTKAPKKKARPKSGSTRRFVKPVMVPDAMVDPDAKEFMTDETIGNGDNGRRSLPDTFLNSWNDSLLDLSYRIDPGAEAKTISGTALFKRGAPAIAIMTFAFRDARGNEVGRISLPIAPAASNRGAGMAMADFCRIIDPSISGALAVGFIGYTTGDPSSITTVADLKARAGELDVATACRRGNERTVYVLDRGHKTIHAVPVEVWHDPASPFWEIVITVYGCD